MKKNLLSTFVISLFTITAYSQKPDVRQVLAASTTPFQKGCPGIKGNWEKETGHYEVSFINGGQVMSAVIDAKGTLLETETDIAVNDQPANVDSYVKVRFEGVRFKEAAGIIKTEGEIVHEVEVKKRDVVFYANGRYLRSERN